VKNIKAGKLGGEVIPMNFNNGGFIFQFNDALSSTVTPEIKKAVEDQIGAFRAEAGTLHNYTEVDYSKL